MSSLMDWSLIVLSRITTPHHLLPMKVFFFSHGFPLGKNKSTYNSCSRGSKSYSSIDNERSALASYEASGKPGIDQEWSSVLFYLQEGWFAGFWNTKHLLRLDHSCAIAIPNSDLVSGAGLFIFRPRGCVPLCMLDVEHYFQTAVSNAAQNSSADCSTSRLAVLINIWRKKKLIQKQKRVCKTGPLCDSVAQCWGWSECVLLWQVTH